MPISRWLDDGSAEVIKTGPHRTVYRLVLPKGNFYLKHYRTPDWQAVLQNIVRPCKADLEWRAAQTASGLGLRTFETVAVGRKRSLGVIRENYLISREISAAVPLDQFVLETWPNLPAHLQQSARRGIAAELGRIAARLHQSGQLHRDLHPGNLLIRPEGNFDRIYLIDLHAMSGRRRLSERQIAGNLALLNNFFCRLTSKTDRLRFLRAYQQHRPVPADLVPAQTRQVNRVCRAELAKADRRGDLKWRRGNRRLVILDHGPNHGRGLAEIGKRELEQFLGQPERLFDRSRFIGWRKQLSDLREGLLELSIAGKPRRAILLIRLHDGSARQAWEMGHALLRRRLPALRPLFFVETKNGPWDYLAVEQITGAKSLKRWLLDQNSNNRADACRLNRLAGDLGKLLQRLHVHGFHQPRLTLSSFLIQEQSGKQSLRLAGLETLQQPGEIVPSQKIPTLANLVESLPQAPMTSTLCLRFLRGYLCEEFSSEWKSLWRSVALLASNAENKEAA